jgi:hypothetical protein
MRGFMICTPHQTLLVIRYQIKNEVGGVCGLYGKQEMCIQGFVRSPEKETTWKT